MKEPMQLDLPEELVSRVSNHLYAEMTPDELTQDILVVELRNGLFVDVGWYPENNTEGTFWVRVFGRDWRSQVTRAIKTSDAYEVVQWVERLAEYYGKDTVALPDTATIVANETIQI